MSRTTCVGSRCRCWPLLGATGRGAERSGTARALEELRSLVPRAEVAIVPAGGGTYCMIEQPDATLDALLPFLARLMR